MLNSNIEFRGKKFHELPVEERGWRFCRGCGKPFIRTCGVQKWCSGGCKAHENQTKGSMECSAQYSRISGNWEKYFPRLLGKGRKEFLTTPILMEILKKQDYKCALSGIPLTCQLEQGKKFKTNVSIDRIVPGKPYTADNVQLVCSALNSWRGNTDLQEFIWFCMQVAKFQENKE